MLQGVSSSLNLVWRPFVIDQTRWAAVSMVLIALLNFFVFFNCCWFNSFGKEPLLLSALLSIMRFFCVQRRKVAAKKEIFDPGATVEGSSRKVTVQKEEFDPGATVEGSSGFIKTESEIIDSGEHLIDTSI